jgi:26S proteasome regulatory subunit N8
VIALHALVDNKASVGRVEMEGEDKKAAGKKDDKKEEKKEEDKKEKSKTSDK